jgi:myo-inositol-1(or 4)-monophosphatase
MTQASLPAVAAVREAVREAGALALRWFRRPHGRWEKSPGQLVTEADLAIDHLLKGLLGRIAPEAGWLSEETIDDRSRFERPLVWVVDPIDGTRSFAAGKPEFTICVGLLEMGRPAIGLVLNPATGELFEAVRGAGAFLDGRPIRAHRVEGLAQAHVAVSAGESRRRNFAALLPEARIVEIGSLAYKLVLVAAGRFDAYLSLRRAHDWDIAAAQLILEEAGGVLTDARGQTISYDHPEPWRHGLIAATPALHRALLEVALTRLAG